MPATVSNPFRRVDRLGFSLLLALLTAETCLQAASAQRSGALHRLVRLVGEVRASMVEISAAEGTADGHPSLLDSALVRIASIGSQVPRWALLVAIAEEHERLSFIDSDWREERAGRAACLYSLALELFPRGLVGTGAWAAIFNRTAGVIAQAARARGEIIIVSWWSVCEQASTQIDTALS